MLIPYPMAPRMDKIVLTASARTAGVNPRELRSSGRVPCNVYGSGTKNMTVQCDAFALHKAFAKAGESTIIELEVSGKHVPVLFKEISFDPVSGKELHADFYAVDMKKEIEAQVPIRFEGEAPAVKELAAIFVTSHDHVRVRCLPADLPHDLPVSIAKLAAFHDVVTIADLKIPKSVTVMEKPETVLALVQEPRKEEEIAPPVAATPEGEVPAAEGEAGKEGAAPEAAAAPEGAPAGKEKAPKEKTPKDKK